MLSLTAMRDQMLNSLFLPDSSSDELHVQTSNSFQSATDYFRHCQSQRCKILVCCLTTMGDQILNSLFLPTYHQMSNMFNLAEAFNQPLSFDTAEVTNVRAYICVESDHHERPDSEFSFPARLIIRWATCLNKQQFSISH